MSRLSKLLARVLQVNEEEINENSSPQNINSWDSFNGLMLVMELEKEFGISFTMEEIMDVANVKDIKRHLRKHKVNPDD